MRKFKLTSLALLLLGGVILNSCGKDNKENNNPVGQGGGPDDQYKIVITTDKAIGEELEIYYSFANINKPGYSSDITKNTEARKKPWIDFNNNGIKEKNEFLEHGEGYISGVISSQTITVYGKVVMLSIGEEQKVTKLDISQNNFLETLGIVNNPLKTLDVTKNSNLERLEIKGKDPKTGIGLTSLNISGDKNPKINHLDIQGSGMETLDISNFPNLEKPLFSGNIKNIKINNNPKITDLSYITTIQEVESLDVSNNPNLEILGIGIIIPDFKLKKINLKNTPKLGKFFLLANPKPTYLTKSYDISFCVQTDVKVIPSTWEKGYSRPAYKQQLTINYQSNPCP